MSANNPNTEVAVDSNDESGEELSTTPESSPGKGTRGGNQLASTGLEDLEEQLNGLTFDPESFIRSLPAPVKRRLKALKKIQMQRLQLQSDFYIEFHNLEAKFAAKFAPLDERRSHIASGEVEPTDSECDWKSDEEDEENAEGEKCCPGTGACAEAGGDTKTPNAVNTPDVTGIPEFWLTVLKREGEFGQMIQDHDESILRHMTNIKLVLSEPSQPVSFTLEFHFSPNEYFSNKVLTKKYNMKMEPDERELLFEGPEIASCEGCEIEWMPNKNVTVKTIKKKQKHKKSGVQRTVTKQVQNESFFNFFSPPSAEEQDEPTSEEIEASLQNDYEMGNFLREEIIPRAVLYFTGDAIEESDDEDYDEDDDDEDDDDDEENFVPQTKFAGGRGRGMGARNGAMAAPGVADPKNPDCKQQ